MTKKIILLASGSGSNVENICRFFEHNVDIEILGVYTNNPKAGVLNRIKDFGLEGVIFDRDSFVNGILLDEIKSLAPDLIVLAGFLWRIGVDWVETFPTKIINIHPALLPKYGGKGMYGDNIHNLVLKNKEKETGITFHYVNENYDEGEIIAQFKIKIDKFETLNSLKKKISQEELLNYPKIISSFLDE